MQANDYLAKICSRVKKWSLSAEMDESLGGFRKLVCQCKNPSGLSLFESWLEDTWIGMLEFHDHSDFVSISLT